MPALFVYDKFIRRAGCTEGICSVCVDNVAVLPGSG